jgi:hypothetical protein
MNPRAGLPEGVAVEAAGHLGAIAGGGLAPGDGFGLGVAGRTAVATWLGQRPGFPKPFHHRRAFKSLVMLPAA